MSTLTYKFPICNRIRFIKSIKRSLATKQKKIPKPSHKHTVLLPKTDFPPWYSANKRIELDEYILNNCGFKELYEWQQKKVDGKEFILHDGPPYANGPAHMGHALNKILKDIIIRNKLLQGFKINYIPGWDCHGLPIEVKVIIDTVGENLEPLEIRKRARKFATQAMQDQKAAFKKWGILADWENSCYYTYDSSNIIAQLQQFYKLYEKGIVYRDLKPVYWSPSVKSALAEAELEYQPDHCSSTWTVRLPITFTPWSLDDFNISPADRHQQLYALIWTTTPWTLPANAAVAFNCDITYALVNFSNHEGVYIVAHSLVKNLEKELKSVGKILATISGEKLAGCKYKHMFSEESLPLLHGAHVNAEAGTGLVHTAPAHGHEDFLLAIAHNLPTNCSVDESGLYTEDVCIDSLINEPVLSDDTQTIISKLLGNNVINKKNIKHSYPYDWRTKKPVIIRSSLQWFIQTDDIKKQALESLNNVNIIPKKKAQTLINQVVSRPYWCISRQRCWGVPLPVLYHGDAEDQVINRDLIDNYCDLLKIHGGDFWWSLTMAEMVPEKILKKYNLKLNELKKSQDIMDIWIDSGLTWSTVLDGKTADVYVEGTDQCTGWFQSSLLTSVALTGSAPYKNLYIHGFTLDSNGRKMSKSIGNVIDPQDIINGIKESTGTKALTTAIGIDVFRWWVAAHGSQHSNIPVTETSLGNCIDEVKKLRNTIKYLLGSIDDLPKEKVQGGLTVTGMSVTDMYMLHSLATFSSKVYDYYNSYQFNRVCKTVINFISHQLSAFYFPVIKDKLYCDGEDSEQRRNNQLCLYFTLNTLGKALAPILPVLVEEVYSHHPHNNEKVPFFQSTFPNIPTNELLKTKTEVDEIMNTAFTIKEKIDKERPLNSSSSQLWGNIAARTSIYENLKSLQVDESSCSSELVNILQISGLTLHLDNSISNAKDFSVEISMSKCNKCARCWKYNVQSKNSLCDRCSHVIT